MDQSEEIVRLLAEIRDLQREHLAEYQRISQQVMEFNKAASERASVQYRASVKSGQAAWWALLVLIAICLGANFLMLMHVAAGR